MIGERLSRARRPIGAGLMLIGMLSIGWAGAQIVQARIFQHEERVAFDRVLDGAPAPIRLVGRLDIPRLRVSVMVMEGDDARTLKTAVGHLPDTALPWEPGNSALAGHRDTYFRPLKNIQTGDAIRLASSRGSFSYTVRTIRIVQPDDVSVLAPTSTNMLTLVTCYPFSYIGSAPKRFIVQAERN